MRAWNRSGTDHAKTREGGGEGRRGKYEKTRERGEDANNGLREGKGARRQEELQVNGEGESVGGT